MVAKWATWRERAKAELRGFLIAMLCGYLVSLTATAVLARYAPSLAETDIVRVVMAIATDSAGFYGVLWWVERRSLPAQMGRAKLALLRVAKKYWLAEIIDNWLRAGLLMLAGVFTGSAFLANLAGNLLADVAFLGVAVATGVAFSDWCIAAVRSAHVGLRRLVTPIARVSAAGAAALAVVLAVLGSAHAPLQLAAVPLRHVTVERRAPHW